MLVLFTNCRRTINRRSRKGRSGLFQDEVLNAFVRAVHANHAGVVANMHLGVQQVARMFDPVQTE